MKISELLKTNKPTLSFEVFPPKTDAGFESIRDAVIKIADLKPDFMSVTYGANGGAKKYSAKIAKEIQERGTPAIAHMTCVESDHDSLAGQLATLKDYGIENVLALRGDLPEDADPLIWDFQHASDLAGFIKEEGTFCVGGACYPEKHPESVSIEEDIDCMKIKQDAGCEFFTTQMFFDNEIFYRYLFKLRAAGVTVPVIAGLMPVTNAKQMERIMSLSQAFIPRSYVHILDKYGDKPESLKQASIAYTTAQIVDLLSNGINNIHIYAMNNVELAKTIQENLSELIPSCAE